MLFDSEVRQTLAERTASVIRGRILAHAPGFAPGDRLLPEALAETIGVSITPIREALRLLGTEGLVEVLPRRGVRVATLTLDEIGDLTAVRGGIEGLAIRLRGEIYSPSEIRELQLCLADCERAISNRDLLAYRSADRLVHRLIIAGARSPVLSATYEQLHGRAQILELYFTDTWDLYEESVREHGEIVELLAHGPIERIEPAVWQHWQRSRSRVAERLGKLAAFDPVGVGSPSGDATASGL